MITARLRTIIFLGACAVLGYGLWVLLHRMQMAPPDGLKDLDAYAQGFITDAGKGLWWVLLGAFLALVTVLWNSSALSKNWLDVLAYAFKGFGALVLLLLIILFLRHQEIQQVVTARKKEELLQLETSKEKDRVQRERNRERVSTFLSQLAERSKDVSGRKIAVTIAGSYLRDDTLMSVSLAQALHATALYDPDDSVKICARQMLYPLPDSMEVDWKAVESPDFAQAVVRLLQEHPDLLERAPYFRYAGLLRSELKNDGDLMTALAAVESAKSERLLAALSSISSWHATVPPVTPTPGAPTPVPSATPVTFPNASPTPALGASSTPAPSTSLMESANANETRAVLLAATYADKSTRQKARILLASASESRLKEIISDLPPEIRPALPPRVYVRVAEKKDLDSQKLKDVRTMLRDLPLQGEEQARTIVPKTIWVGNLPATATAPTVTEVRYYEGEDSRAMATRLASKLKSLGFSKVVISPEKPTAADINGSRDISGHLEIWFAKGDLP